MIGMNGHRREAKEVRGGHNEVYVLEFHGPLHKIITVNVSVKAVFDAVFMKHVDYLTTDKIGENGREVKKNEKLLVALTAFSRLLLEPLSLFKAHFEPHSLAVDDLLIFGLGISHRSSAEP